MFLELLNTAYIFMEKSEKEKLHIEKQSKYSIDNKPNYHNKSFTKKPLLFQKMNKRIMQMKKTN